MDGSFIRRMRISCRGTSPVPQGTDIIEKDLPKQVPFLVEAEGVAPGEQGTLARQTRRQMPGRLQFDSHSAHMYRAGAQRWAPALYMWNNRLKRLLLFRP